MKAHHLLLLLLAFGCTAYRQQKAVDVDSTRRDRGAPAIKADAQMIERFSFQPLALKQATLLEQVDQYKNELASQGKYDCCVKPSCSECALNSGECHCRRVVEKNGPCCGECTQAWIEGRGNVAGVDREQILEHLGCVRELYEKKVPEGETAPGAISPRP